MPPAELRITAGAPSPPRLQLERNQITRASHYSCHRRCAAVRQRAVPFPTAAGCFRNVVRDVPARNLVRDVPALVFAREVPVSTCGTRAGVTRLCRQPHTGCFFRIWRHPSIVIIRANRTEASWQQQRHPLVTKFRSLELRPDRCAGCQSLISVERFSTTEWACRDLNAISRMPAFTLSKRLLVLQVSRYGARVPVGKQQVNWSLAARHFW